MKYWFLKSEPNEYSWQTMKKEDIAPWDGVRNHQAQKNMREMKKGDLAFFYHSGKDKNVVGIVEIYKEFYKTDEDPKFGLVDVKYVKSLKNPVALSSMKENSVLKNMTVLKQQRLSVSPVRDSEWEEIMKMSEL